MSTSDSDLIFITETLLSPKISDTEIVENLPYRIHQTDRTGKREGGLCCVAENCVNLLAMTATSNLKEDIIILEGTDHDSTPKYRFILVYRAPNANSWEDESIIDYLVYISITSKHAILVI